MDYRLAKKNISRNYDVASEERSSVMIKAYILADNRMALDAGWDDELLAVEMEELQNQWL